MLAGPLGERSCPNNHVWKRACTTQDLDRPAASQAAMLAVQGPLGQRTCPNNHVRACTTQDLDVPPGRGAAQISMYMWKRARTTQDLDVPPGRGAAQIIMCGSGRARHKIWICAVNGNTVANRDQAPCRDPPQVNMRFNGKPCGPGFGRGGDFWILSEEADALAKPMDIVPLKDKWRLRL
ncbi:hypothetical protein C8R43DRAFT_951539 [Mycena crocata]|nr:hypothetical protein C8R43DRAFT_951539 [Mycena crocata]